MPKLNNPIGLQNFFSFVNTKRVIAQNSFLKAIDIPYYFHDIIDEGVPPVPILPDNQTVPIFQALTELKEILGARLPFTLPNDKPVIKKLMEKFVDFVKIHQAFSKETIVSIATYIQEAKKRGSTPADLENDPVVQNFKKSMWSMANDAHVLKKQCFVLFNIFNTVQTQSAEDPRHQTPFMALRLLNIFFMQSFTPLCFALNPPDDPSSLDTCNANHLIPHYYPEIWSAMIKLFWLSECLYDHVENGKFNINHIEHLLPAQEWWWLTHALIMSPPVQDDLHTHFQDNIDGKVCGGLPINILACSQLREQQIFHQELAIKGIIQSLAEWMDIVENVFHDHSQKPDLSRLTAYPMAQANYDEIINHIGKSLVLLRKSIEYTFPTEHTDIITLNRVLPSSTQFNCTMWKEYFKYISPSERFSLNVENVRIILRIFDKDFHHKKETPQELHEKLIDKIVSQPISDPSSIMIENLRYMETLHESNLISLTPNIIDHFYKAYKGNKASTFLEYLQQNAQHPLLNEFLCTQTSFHSELKRKTISTDRLTTLNQAFLTWASQLPTSNLFLNLVRALYPEHFQGTIYDTLIYLLELAHDKPHDPPNPHSLQVLSAIIALRPTHTIDYPAILYLHPNRVSHDYTKYFEQKNHYSTFEDYLHSLASPLNIVILFAKTQEFQSLTYDLEIISQEKSSPSGLPLPLTRIPPSWLKKLDTAFFSWASKQPCVVKMLQGMRKLLPLIFPQENDLETFFILAKRISRCGVDEQAVQLLSNERVRLDCGTPILMEDLLTWNQKQHAEAMQKLRIGTAPEAPHPTIDFITLPSHQESKELPNGNGTTSPIAIPISTTSFFSPTNRCPLSGHKLFEIWQRGGSTHVSCYQWALTSLLSPTPTAQSIIQQRVNFYISEFRTYQAFKESNLGMAIEAINTSDTSTLTKPLQTILQRYHSWITAMVATSSIPGNNEAEIEKEIFFSGFEKLLFILKDSKIPQAQKVRELIVQGSIYLNRSSLISPELFHTSSAQVMTEMLSSIDFKAISCTFDKKSTAPRNRHAICIDEFSRAICTICTLKLTHNLSKPTLRLIRQRWKQIYYFWSSQNLLKNSRKDLAIFSSPTHRKRYVTLFNNIQAILGVPDAMLTLREVTAISEFLVLHNESPLTDLSRAQISRERKQSNEHYIRLRFFNERYQIPTIHKLMSLLSDYIRQDVMHHQADFQHLHASDYNLPDDFGAYTPLQSILEQACLIWSQNPQRHCDIIINNPQPSRQIMDLATNPLPWRGRVFSILNPPSERRICLENSEYVNSGIFSRQHLMHPKKKPLSIVLHPTTPPETSSLFFPQSRPNSPKSPEKHSQLFVIP